VELLLFLIVFITIGFIMPPRGGRDQYGNPRDWSLWGALRRTTSPDPDELLYRRTIVRPPLAYAFILFFGALAFANASMLTAPYWTWGVVVPLTLLSPRSGIVVNRRERAITRWWGLWVPLLRWTEPASGGALLVLTEHERHHHNWHWFVVTLTVEANASESFHIPTSGARDDTRPVAEEIGAFLDLELLDRTLKEDVIHTPAELRERLARRGIVFADHGAD